MHEIHGTNDLNLSAWQCALYVMQRIPQCPLDVTALTSIDRKCVAAEVNINGRSFTTASVSVRCRYSGNCDVLIEGLRSLARGSLIICGDYNAHHQRWVLPDQIERGGRLSRICDKLAL